MRLRQIYRNVDKTEGKNDICISNLPRQSNKILDGSNLREEGLSSLTVSVGEVQQGKYGVGSSRQRATLHRVGKQRAINAYTQLTFSLLFGPRPQPIG